MIRILVAVAFLRVISQLDRLFHLPLSAQLLVLSIFSYHYLHRRTTNLVKHVKEVDMKYIQRAQIHVNVDRTHFGTVQSVHYNCLKMMPAIKLILVEQI
jgi:hypothetical protein